MHPLWKSANSLPVDPIAHRSRTADAERVSEARCRPSAGALEGCLNCRTQAFGGLSGAWSKAGDGQPILGYVEKIEMSCAAANSMGLLTDTDVGDILDNYLLSSYPHNGPCKARPSSPFSPADALFGKDNGPIIASPWHQPAKEPVGFPLLLIARLLVRQQSRVVALSRTDDNIMELEEKGPAKSRLSGAHTDTLLVQISRSQVHIPRARETSLLMGPSIRSLCMQTPSQTSWPALQLNGPLQRPGSQRRSGHLKPKHNGRRPYQSLLLSWMRAQHTAQHMEATTTTR